jgi:DNA-binding PadR family transcriptional regulator
VSKVTGRPLTSFEQVLLGYIAAQPRSGYGLKRTFSSTPSSVYQPSPGALYPALRRLVRRGLVTVEETVSEHGRALRLHRITRAGLAEHMCWLRQPVAAESVGSDLGLHVMRFAMMENRLPPDEVLAFLTGLADALDGFVEGMEGYAASAADVQRRHAALALEHGIAVHRASLEWVRSALGTLAAPAGGQPAAGPAARIRQENSKLAS